MDMKTGLKNQCPRCGSYDTRVYEEASGGPLGTIDDKLHISMKCEGCDSIYCEIYNIYFKYSEYKSK